MTFSAQYAHWHQFFESISVSSLDFYKTLDEELTARKVPETATSQVEFAEGGPISTKRVYLKIQRDWLTYHICVAPFGTGFFVSSRLLVSPWKSWPVIALIAGILCFGLFGLTLVTAILTKNLAIGLFLSFMASVPTVILFILALIVWIFICLRMTYYRLDSMLAFHEAVHGLLVARVNKVIEATGRKPLTDEQSKPVFHRLLRR